MKITILQMKIKLSQKRKFQSNPNKIATQNQVIQVKIKF